MRPEESPLFRKAAISRLSSPEELDVLIRVTSPRAWIGLIGICVGLLLAIAWGFLGSIPTRVLGQGILLRPGGVFDVLAPSSGRVLEVTVKEGDAVAKGQLVVRLEQPELEKQIENARADLLELEKQQEQIARFDSTDLALEKGSLEKRRANLQDSITFNEQQLRALEERIQNEEQLLEQGLITKQSLLATKATYFSTKDLIEKSRVELEQLDLSRLRSESTTSQKGLSGQMRINESRRRIKLLETQLDLATRVLSPYDGKVLELRVNRADLVGPGAPLLSLQLTGRTEGGLEAVFYVSAAEGKNVKTAMAAEISPATVKREEYGFIRGSVTYVSEFPSTRQGMMRVLANDDLVKTLSGSGAPFAVYARLERAPGTESGYRWSSPQGPPTPIQSGTLCTVRVTIEEDPPITLVLPALKKLLGVS